MLNNNNTIFLAMPRGGNKGEAIGIKVFTTSSVSFTLNTVAAYGSSGGLHVVCEWVFCLIRLVRIVEKEREERLDGAWCVGE